MMRCPLCSTSSYTRQITYLEDGSRDTIVQCQNVYCSATFLTNESFYMALEKSELKPDYKSRRELEPVRAERGSNNG